MSEPEEMNAAAIYAGSDGDATKALYARLEALGPRGVIAMNLFRACKASERAKKYRRRFKGLAYEKKNWSLKLLCEALTKIAPFQYKCSSPGCGYPDGKPCIGCGFVVDHGALLWGWKEDPAQEFHKWVLYVDLPTGQVSFHSATPLSTERYPGHWDGQHKSAERIIRFTEIVLNGTQWADPENDRAMWRDEESDQNTEQPTTNIEQAFTQPPLAPFLP